jgi:histidinol dehydrogenase
VGLYIPGGTAVLPSTFLMLGIPARIAGCHEIVVCSPPQKNGKVNAFIAYVALMLGINKVYLAGGSQAIAAMAYGTETLLKLIRYLGREPVCNQGQNHYTITTTTAIDMPAGPSEVLVIADKTAKPAYVAADLLAQAEHGIDSQAVLVCTSESIAQATLAQVEKQLPVLPRAEIAKQALDNSYIIITGTLG